MKYLVTTSDGTQTVVESDKSLAHFSVGYNLSTDIQPIIDEDEVEVKPTPKKPKTK